jgi:hypothetical protein
LENETRELAITEISLISECLMAPRRHIGKTGGLALPDRLGFRLICPEQFERGRRRSRYVKLPES